MRKFIRKTAEVGLALLLGASALLPISCKLGCQPTIEKREVATSRNYVSYASFGKKDGKDVIYWTTPGERGNSDRSKIFCTSLEGKLETKVFSEIKTEGVNYGIGFMFAYPGGIIAEASSNDVHGVQRETIHLINDGGEEVRKVEEQETKYPADIFGYDSQALYGEMRNESGEPVNYRISMGGKLEKLGVGDNVLPSRVIRQRKSLKIINSAIERMGLKYGLINAAEAREKDGKIEFLYKPDNNYGVFIISLNKKDFASEEEYNQVKTTYETKTEK
jgi:hypothetical protein